MSIIRGETGAQRSLGYEIDTSDPKRHGLCYFVVDEGHTNRHGALHGGLASVMLDNAMAAAAALSVDATGRAPFLTVSMNVNYVGPAFVGQRLTARGWLKGGGRSLHFAEAELSRDDGALVATATGVFRRVPKERLAEGGDA